MFFGNLSFVAYWWLNAIDDDGHLRNPLARMIIGLGTGGGYDLWARMVARHMGRRLPGNPTIISQNMEGAGSFRAASYMYSQAPKDGTAMALIARVVRPRQGRSGLLWPGRRGRPVA